MVVLYILAIGLPLAFVIWASYLWVYYLIRLVKNEEELAERLQAERRRREEARRQEEDRHSQAMGDANLLRDVAQDALQGMQSSASSGGEGT